MTLIARHRLDVDVAIVGSGFAGSLLALALTRHGQRVALIDRVRHPRFVIGESSTPLANLLIEELADRHDLPQLRPFTKWGTWKAAHPDVACGLKRGFSFFRHAPGTPFLDDGEHARQLLVAASPHDAIADTHWYRPDFDHWLFREAECAGVVCHEGLTLDAACVRDEAVTLEGRDERGGPIEVHAGFLVDASGPRGYLHRALDLGEVPLRWLPPTRGLYTHFTDVRRWDELHRGDEAPPYPVDDAALHHVLDDAWIWILRFDNGITSAGIAATDDVAERFGLADGAGAWQRVLQAYPSVGAQFELARPTRPFEYTPRIGHRVATLTGRAFALLPSAAGVIDPLLSTGFPLALLGIGRLVDILTGTRPGALRDAALDEYATITRVELDATERLVAALYATMADFPVFKRLTALYFAAASYTETVRRLGRPERAPGFLMHRHPVFGPALHDLTGRALRLHEQRDPGARPRLLDDITAAIAPFDVAGINDAGRRDWYPVEAADLYAARERLGATTTEIDGLLARCGFMSPDAPQPAHASTGAYA